VLFIFTCYFQVKGQETNLEVRGVVKDSSDTTLPSATVILIQAKDSVMSAFAVTDKEGAFRFRRVKPGEYILQVSYVGYGNFSRKELINSSNGFFDFGEIRMLPKSEVLEEVAISADAIPILIKKDTVEYNAKAFKTKPNDLVEDLLRKLPGVEVQEDGTIKAHGEEVKKIRVDGKEFFGNDTRIASKNLPADAVDKVQVFDELSEMSQFTGIDDGERDKTINLALKEGRNKGYFGNISGGYGTNNRYQGKININRFRKDLQLSIIGSANNVNQQSYSPFEYNGMMGGLGGMMGGGIKVIRMDGSGGGGSSGSGISTSQMGGINLNKDLSPKTKLYGSYFFNHLGNAAVNNISRTNFFAENTYSSNRNSETTSGNYSQRLNLNLKHKIDDTQDLSLRTNISFSNGTSDRFEKSTTYDTLNALANSSLTNNNGESNAGNFSSNLLYRKRFGDRGRNLVTQLNITIGNNVNSNILFSNSSYYNLVVPFTDTLYQRQEINSNNLNYSGEISYTEPLGKRNYLELSYQYMNYTNTLNKDFFDIASNIEMPNIELTTGYNRDYNSNRGGLTWSRNRDRSTINVGADLQYSNLKGQIDENPRIARGYLYILPSANYRVEISSSNHFNINYNTAISEPTLQQLQPIVDNSDQLNTYVGNPDLKPQYIHRLGLGFNSFDSFNFRSFFLYISGGYTQNKITNSTFVDSLLRQVTMPVNVDYDYSMNGFINFGTPLKFIKSKINVGGSSTISKSLVFVNQSENKANRFNTQVNFSIENIKKENFDLRLGTRFMFNNTRYSQNEDLNQDFTTQVYFSDLSIFIGKWTLNAELNYTLYRGSAFPDQQNIPLVKAYIGRTFLKNDRGELRIQGFDLLNQNTGINRSSDLNYIQEERVNTLSRYLMFTFTYSLRAMGKSRKDHVEMELH